MTTVASVRGSAALTRPGSPQRALWLYLSSTASMWALWTLAWLVIARVQEHDHDEFWGLAVYIVYVVGTVLAIALNAVVWFTLGWLIDAKARPPWPWYVAVGIVLGAWIAIAFWSTNLYSLIAGLVIAVGGYVVGPAVAQRAFRSRGWRIAVASVVAAAVLAVVAVLL